MRHPRHMLYPLNGPNYTDDYTFVKSSIFHHPSKIRNVIPGDYNQDGKLDILVVSEGSRSSELAIQVYLGRAEGGFGASCKHSG